MRPNFGASFMSPIVRFALDVAAFLFLLFVGCYAVWLVFTLGLGLGRAAL